MSRGEMARLRDVDVFAERLIGEGLWDHQLEVAQSRARFRMVCAGRQVGKSRTLAVIALHHAYIHAGHHVLIVSAGDEAAKALLGTIAGLARSEWLGGSIAADDSRKLVLSNGSVIWSIPASEKQARGPSIHLLILDEACFIGEALWEAVKFTILATKGRVVMTSTPFGRQDRFFARHYRMGVDGEEGCAAWHWPSTVSPLVDPELVELWRRTDAPRVFRREVLAEWVDEAGQYFTHAELENLADDYELVSPPTWSRRAGVVGGVDWGFSDASTLVVVAGDTPAEDGAGRYWVPFLVERFGMPYDQFIGEVVATAGSAGSGSGFLYERIVAECNGVGQMPAMVLGKQLWQMENRNIVEAFHTTAQSKEDAFGLVKLFAQQRRLRVPRHPGLLSQLAALEYETSESGSVRIAVPESRGHDDLAMGLALAITPVQEVEMVPATAEIVGHDDVWSDEDEEAFLRDTRFSAY